MVNGYLTSPTVSSCVANDLPYNYRRWWYWRLPGCRSMAHWYDFVQWMAERISQCTPTGWLL